MTMRCDECGRDVPEGSAFCSHCGAQLAGVEQSTDPGGTTGAARLKPRGMGNQPNEDELWIGTYSPKAMIGWVIGAAVLTVLGVVAVALYDGSPTAWTALVIAVLVIGALIGLVVLYRQMTVRYQLTTYRLFHETGLLRRTRERIEVIDIDDVTLTQGLIERMFDVGTIHVQSSDISHGNLHMPGIEDARRVTDLIDNTRRAERQRRGLFMENV